MTYKNRLICLFSLITILALFYTGSFFINIETGSARSASMIWLDSKLAAKADRIAIKSDALDFEFVKRSDQWFVSHNGSEYPARHLRVEDFLGIFTKRAPWPVRSSGSSSYERFGLNADTADRLSIFAGNETLLDLLTGFEDNTGQEIYVRRYSEAGQYAPGEVRSGNSILKTYITSQVSSWYNLRLIPESEDGKVSVKNVQRLTVYNGDTTLVFSRRNRTWTVTGADVESPDLNKIENYISLILNTEGDNFDNSVTPDDPELRKRRITVELDNGNVIIINFSDPDDSGRCDAYVSGRDYIYSIPLWASSRVFNEVFWR